MPEILFTDAIVLCEMVGLQLYVTRLPGTPTQLLLKLRGQTSINNEFSHCGSTKPVSIFTAHNNTFVTLALEIYCLVLDVP